MFRTRTFCLAVALLSAFSFSASAALITFDDKGDFLAATAATSATGPLPELGIQLLNPVTLGSLTFTAGPGVNSLTFGGVSHTPDWTTRLPGADLQIGGDENFNVDVAAPVTAFGFDFVEPENDENVDAIFFDSEFTVTLLSGGLLVDTFVFNAPNDVATFVGVWSTDSFDRVEIRETFGGIENEFWGEFYTSSSPLTVPEPHMLLVFTTGLSALAMRRRRRRSSKAD